MLTCGYTLNGIFLSLIINRKEKKSVQITKMLVFGGCSEILIFRDMERKRKYEKNDISAIRGETQRIKTFVLSLGRK